MFPTSVSSNVSAQQLILSGYFPDYNVEVTNLPQHGFGTLNNWKAHASTELRPAAALSAATGFSFRLSRGTRLYAGLSVEYGLTDLKAKGDSMPLVTYNPTNVSGLKANGVLNMQNAGRMTSLILGLQVRLSFETTRSRPKVRPKPKRLPHDTARQDTARQDTATANISDEEADLLQQPIIFGFTGETEVYAVQRQHLDGVASIMDPVSDCNRSCFGIGRIAYRDRACF